MRVGVDFVCIISLFCYKVLDRAEQLREMEANILPAFLRLQELVSVWKEVIVCVLPVESKWTCGTCTSRLTDQREWFFRWERLQNQASPPKQWSKLETKLEFKHGKIFIRPFINFFLVVINGILFTSSDVL